jgi:hypothetical protein
MRRRSNVIRRQGEHHLGRQLVDLCLAFQGFGEPDAPGLHDGLLRPGFMPVAGRGNRRVPAFLETCAHPAWSFGQGLPSILVAGDSGCWTVARSGGRRLLRANLPASWDSGPVAGSPQDGCFSRRVLGAVTRQRSGAEGGCRGLHGPQPWATAFQGLARLLGHGNVHQVGRTLARGRRGTRRNCPHDCRTGPGAVATMQIGVARLRNRKISAPALHPGQASPGGSSWASRPAFSRVLWCRLTFMTDAMPLRGRN